MCDLVINQRASECEFCTAVFLGAWKVAPAVCVVDMRVWSVSTNARLVTDFADMCRLQAGCAVALSASRRRTGGRGVEPGSCFQWQHVFSSLGDGVAIQEQRCPRSSVAGGNSGESWCAVWTQWASRRLPGSGASGAASYTQFNTHSSINNQVCSGAETLATAASHVKR